MTQLPAISIDDTPRPAHSALEARIARLHNGLGVVGYLPAEQAPTGDVRHQIETRVASLGNWLAPLSATEDGQKAARAMVAAVLAVQPTQSAKGDAADASRIQNLYVRALGDLPRFALQHACGTALRHGIGGKVWAPTPAQLREVAEDHCRAYVEERRKIQAVLTAKIGAPQSDPDRKARLLASCRILGAAMSMKDVIDRAARAGREIGPEEIPDAQLSPEARRQRHEAHAREVGVRPMPSMGDALRRSLEERGAIRPPPEMSARFDESEVA